MYLAKALYQRFVGTIYMLRAVYALFFAVVGLDRLMQFSGIDWESYLSALLMQTVPIKGSVILVSLAVAQIVTAGMLLIPYLARIGAYCAFLLLIFVAVDLVIANGAEFYSRAAIYAVMSVGSLALIQLQSIYYSLHS